MIVGIKRIDIVDTDAKTFYDIQASGPSGEVQYKLVFQDGAYYAHIVLFDDNFLTREDVIKMPDFFSILIKHGVVEKKNEET